MKLEVKQKYSTQIDLLQLIATFAASVVSFTEAIENPGRLAILSGLAVSCIAFGASLAIYVINVYNKKKRDQSLLK